MADRLPVKKTYKLFIGGAFPRSESGRTYEAEGQNVARASRKDVRDSVRAARAAWPKWAGMTAYNRGQVLYRLAEMIEARTSFREASATFWPSASYVRPDSLRGNAPPMKSLYVFLTGSLSATEGLASGEVHVRLQSVAPTLPAEAGFLVAAEW